MSFSPELCFVVEDDQSIVGFAVAAVDAKELQRRIRIAWIPELETKYPDLMVMWNNESAVRAKDIPSHLKVSFIIFF